MITKGMGEMILGLEHTSLGLHSLRDLKPGTSNWFRHEFLSHLGDQVEISPRCFFK